MDLPRKALIVGTPISLTSYDEVIEAVAVGRSDRAMTIAVCNVHSVMSARKNAALRRALATVDVATPDGVPIVWAIRLSVDPSQERVYGPDLMLKMLIASEQRGWRHYLYGSTSETLDALRTTISELVPEAQVVGWESPPFRPLTPEEEDETIDRIRDSGADIVWIGLGMPKQELWMDRISSRLPEVTLVGVGAAFDFIAGTKRQAPAWMRSSGLEWLFRLIQEPRRLWRRYLWNNPAYLLLMAREVVSRRFNARVFPGSDDADVS